MDLDFCLSISCIYIKNNLFYINVCQCDVFVYEWIAIVCFYDLYACDQYQMNIKHELSTSIKHSYQMNRPLHSCVLEYVDMKQTQMTSQEAKLFE